MRLESIHLQVDKVHLWVARVHFQVVQSAYWSCILVARHLDIFLNMDAISREPIGQSGRNFVDITFIVCSECLLNSVPEIWHRCCEQLEKNFQMFCD